MSGFSTNLKKGEYREILFWLLLLGSWQFLASPGNKNGVVGAAGTAAFLVFAWNSLDRLTNLGLDYVRWRATTGTNWLYAVVGGVLAGAAIFAIGSASRQGMGLSNECRLIVLQVTLGPVLERGRVPWLPLHSADMVVLQTGRRRWPESVGCRGSGGSLCSGSYVATGRQLAAAHMHHVHRNTLRLAQESFGVGRSGAASYAAENLTLYAVAGVAAALSDASSAL
jgi:hypothetical protein